MAFFYEIRSADNTVLKRDGGFATQDAAKTAAREDGRVARPLKLNVGCPVLRLWKGGAFDVARGNNCTR